MADHWVPQCYLKNFTISGDVRKVYVYERGRDPIQVGIHNVAAENNLYTFTNKDTGEQTREIETLFSQLEGAATPALDKITEHKNLDVLTGPEHGALIQFLAFLATRGPTFSEIQKNMHKEGFKTFMQAYAENPDILRSESKKLGLVFNNEEEFEEMRKSLLNKDYDFDLTGGKAGFFKGAAETAMELCDIFTKEKGSYLLVSNSERVFITSDNPVIIQTPPEVPPHLAGGYKYGTVIIPISPKVCYVLRSRPLKKEIITIRDSHVDYINNSIMKSARRQVYANLSSRSIQQRYVLYPSGEDSKISTKRIKHTPYTFTFGPSKDNELPALDRYSMSWGEIDAKIRKFKKAESEGSKSH